MSRKRSWTDLAFVQAVGSNITIAGALRDLGLKLTGANYRTMHTNVARLKLNTSHWLGQGHMRGKPGHCSKRIPDSEVFVEKSTYSVGSHIRKRLLANGVENKCGLCGMPAVWCGEPLVLIVDHINGVHTDNRRNNLRLLCPNCNSQTPTFAGRNIKIGRVT